MEVQCNAVANRPESSAIYIICIKQQLNIILALLFESGCPLMIFGTVYSALYSIFSLISIIWDTE